MSIPKQYQELNTLGKLQKSGYKFKSIKQELRDNLISKMKKGETVFPDVIGYDETVLPDIQRAILAGHSMNLLGLRGQAKTRIARNMTLLLDEYIPYIKGAPLFDSPEEPLSYEAKSILEEKGDKTPISWMHRSDRYVEKLATPDVSVADLIGDIDPIKAANQKLDYSSEQAIHFGIIPRANRSIFVINELPDLQPRIQVALFNILQEGDIQIRGFKFRWPLDIQFMFTANPEDYTNRGSIITPLKDRIQSQILTHYPSDIEDSKKITWQEADIQESQREKVMISGLVEDLLESIAFEARESEFIDQKSGVSARMSITALEHLYASCERRMIINDEVTATARISDLCSVIPAITGKVELVYEGEQEGSKNVALRIIGSTFRKKFPQIFVDPAMVRRKKMDSPYVIITDWFSVNELDLHMDDSTEVYRAKLDTVEGLREMAEKYIPNAENDDLYVWMEFILHSLGEFNLLNKTVIDANVSFSDIMNALFTDDQEEEYN